MSEVKKLRGWITQEDKAYTAYVSRGDHHMRIAASLADKADRTGNQIAELLSAQISYLELAKSESEIADDAYARAKDHLKMRNDLVKRFNKEFLKEQKRMKKEKTDE